MKNQDLGGEFPKKMGRGLSQFAYLRGKFAKNLVIYLRGLRRLLNDTMAHRQKISKVNNIVLH